MSYFNDSDLLRDIIVILYNDNIDPKTIKFTSAGGLLFKNELNQIFPNPADHHQDCVYLHITNNILNNHYKLDEPFPVQISIKNHCNYELNDYTIVIQENQRDPEVTHFRDTKIIENSLGIGEAKVIHSSLVPPDRSTIATVPPSISARLIHNNATYTDSMPIHSGTISLFPLFQYSSLLFQYFQTFPSSDGFL